MTALRRVVEHDIKQDLQPSTVQRPDHRLELPDLPARPVDLAVFAYDCLDAFGKRRQG